MERGRWGEREIGKEGDSERGREGDGERGNRERGRERERIIKMVSWKANNRFSWKKHLCQLNHKDSCFKIPFFIEEIQCSGFQK